MNGDTIHYVLHYQGFEAAEGDTLFSHIHFGQRGVAGGVAAFLCGGGGRPACTTGSGTFEGDIHPCRHRRAERPGHRTRRDGRGPHRDAQGLHVRERPHDPQPVRADPRTDPARPRPRARGRPRAPLGPHLVCWRARRWRRALRFYEALEAADHGEPELRGAGAVDDAVVERERDIARSARPRARRRGRPGARRCGRC